MKNLEQLTQTITSAIKQNGVGAITGEVLQGVLLAIKDKVKLSSFEGIATPTTTAVTDYCGEHFYLASTAGTYNNFGGTVVHSGDVVMFYKMPNSTTWSSILINSSHVVVDAAPTANSTNAVQSGGVKTYVDGKVADCATSAQVTQLSSKVGDLSDLETEDKTDLVTAINEARQSGGSGDQASQVFAYLKVLIRSLSNTAFLTSRPDISQWAISGGSSSGGSSSGGSTTPTLETFVVTSLLNHATLSNAANSVTECESYESSYSFDSGWGDYGSFVKLMMGSLDKTVCITRGSKTISVGNVQDDLAITINGGYKPFHTARASGAGGSLWRAADGAETFGIRTGNKVGGQILAIRESGKAYLNIITDSAKAFAGLSNLTPFPIPDGATKIVITRTNTNIVFAPIATNETGTTINGGTENYTWLNSQPGITKGSTSSLSYYYDANYAAVDIPSDKGYKWIFIHFRTKSSSWTSAMGVDGNDLSTIGLTFYFE